MQYATSTTHEPRVTELSSGLFFQPGFFPTPLLFQPCQFPTFLLRQAFLFFSFFFCQPLLFSLSFLRSDDVIIVYRPPSPNTCMQAENASWRETAHWKSWTLMHPANERKPRDTMYLVCSSRKKCTNQEHMIYYTTVANHKVHTMISKRKTHFVHQYCGTKCQHKYIYNMYITNKQ